MRSVLVYVCDKFVPIDIDLKSLFELADREPLKLFKENVKPFVVDCVDGVSGVEVGGIYFSPEHGEVVVEYIIKHAHGDISAKLIYAERAEEALMRYYQKIRHLKTP